VTPFAQASSFNDQHQANAENENPNEMRPKSSTDVAQTGKEKLEQPMTRQRSSGSTHLGHKMQSFQIKTQRDLSQGANPGYQPKVMNPQIMGRGSTKVNIQEVQALLNNLKNSGV